MQRTIQQNQAHLPNSTPCAVVGEHLYRTLGKCVHTSILAVSVTDIMITSQHKLTDTLLSLFESASQDLQTVP